MITFRTLKPNKPSHKKPLRFSLYYHIDTKAATRIQEVKQELSDEYGQECSYSVMFAHLAAFYLQHRDKGKIKITDNPELAL